MTSPEGQTGRTFSENKYELQNRVMQHVFGVSDADLDAIMQGENASDPRLARMLQWVEERAATLSDALTNTPEVERDELFETLYIDRDAAVTKFLSAHPELRPTEETLH